jgi:hypothetical protein
MQEQKKAERRPWGFMGEGVLVESTASITLQFGEPEFTIFIIVVSQQTSFLFRNENRGGIEG